MTVKFQMHGQEDLFLKLGRLEDKIEKSIGKKAIRAGAAEYVKLVKRKIPTDSRDDVHLKKSIGIATTKGSRKNDIAVQIGIKGPARAYAHVFEFGGRFHQGTRVFTRTLETSTKAILDRIASRLRLELDKV